jgi:cytosine/adenosine deaminase-related metal-dependent hydrolase
MHPNTDGAAPKTCDLIVWGGDIVTMDSELGVIREGAIAVSGHWIAAVGPTKEVRSAWHAKTEIDARGSVVHPGFIDAHYHTHLHLSRGILSDRPRTDGAAGPALFRKWNELLSERDEHASASAACVEMLCHGYTAFMEPGTAFTPDAVAEAAESVGIRACLADPHLRDVDDGPAGPALERVQGGRDRAIRLMGRQLRRNRNPDALVTGHVAIYGISTGSLELMKVAKACADAHGAVFAMHQSFAESDYTLDCRRLGGYPIARYAESGLLGSNCTFTHLNFLAPEEIAALRAADAGVVWHPGNAMYYGLASRAHFRMGDVIRSGTTVALGNDVAKAWTFGDLPLLGYLLAREWGDFISADSFVAMLTIGGAKAIGRGGDLGSLAVGKRADFVVARADASTFQPGLDPMLHLALISRGRSVDTVIINGAIVVRGGRCLRVDEAAVAETARERAQALARRLDITPDLRDGSADRR